MITFLTLTAFWLSGFVLGMSIFNLIDTKKTIKKKNTIFISQTPNRKNVWYELYKSKNK